MILGFDAHIINHILAKWLIFKDDHLGAPLVGGFARSSNHTGVQ